MNTVAAALATILAPEPLAYILGGTILGVLAGAIPGLTAAMMMILILPLTFYIDSALATMLLVSMYVGGVAGGLIPAIMMRIPGTPAAVVTVFDGYPMARQGLAERALALGAVASFLGGLVSWVFLVLLAPPLTTVALSFSNFEFFALVMLGLVLITSVSERSFLRGLISALLGMLVAMPGVDPSSGSVRLTFGSNALLGGLELLPVLIGMFAVSQLISDMLNIDRPPPQQARVGVLRILRECSLILRHLPNVLRSSVIGTWIGILPGIGANIGSIVAYATARNLSATPERFGKGAEEGIVASETANNATVGGALVPLITLGIPGSVADAILLSALVIHNVSAGPLLLTNHPDVYYGVISAALVANIFMFAIILLAAPYIARLANVPRHYLIPIILMFCVIGSYALNSRAFDVWVMLAFGVVGFLFERLRLPLGPFIIALVLAPLAESSFRAALMASGGSYAPFFTRPVAATCLALSLVLLVWPLVSALRKHMRPIPGGHSG